MGEFIKQLEEDSGIMKGGDEWVRRRGILKVSCDKTEGEYIFPEMKLEIICYNKNLFKKYYFRTCRVNLII